MISCIRFSSLSRSSGLERLGRPEVVVEAVLDRRADAELRLREHVLHGLGEHVRGRVAQHVEPVGRGPVDRLDLGVLLRRPVEVAQPAAVVADHDDGLGAAGRQPGLGDRVGARRPGRDDEVFERTVDTVCSQA